MQQSEGVPPSSSLASSSRSVVRPSTPMGKPVKTRSLSRARHTQVKTSSPGQRRSLRCAARYRCRSLLASSPSTCAYPPWAWPWPSHVIVIVIVIVAVAVAVNLASVPSGQGSSLWTPASTTGAHAHQQQPDAVRGPEMSSSRSPPSGPRFPTTTPLWTLVRDGLALGRPPPSSHLLPSSIAAHRPRTVLLTRLKRRQT
ncbi:hypothetical protein CPLU01_03159 [Colletotrichum plurivorum]|uniref:Uncharacterized protein n=1 Tax=Colletotrichum plurivorum TaxID=2175906 RepID=A0A8H6KTJ2_9PEZI|nr:hypothetical protein CPLU01_03159 [Colletotrichum plurivorum]